MPTETHLAARRPDGAELYYHDTPYPPASVVELFEHYNKGAARELLEMVKAEQATELKMRDRNSSLNMSRAFLACALLSYWRLPLFREGSSSSATSMK